MDQTNLTNLETLDNSQQLPNDYFNDPQVIRTSYTYIKPQNARKKQYSWLILSLHYLNYFVQRNFNDIQLQLSNYLVDPCPKFLDGNKFFYWMLIGNLRKQIRPLLLIFGL